MRVNTQNILRNLAVAFAFVLVLAALTYGLGVSQEGVGSSKSEKPAEAAEAAPKFSIGSLFRRETPSPTPEPSVPTETPTIVPTTFVPPVSIRIPASSGAGGASPTCKLPLDVVVFVDYNRDGIGVTAEMITGLQINLYDVSYNRLGTTYTNNGKASFCLPRKGIYYLDMPYIQTTREFRNDSVSADNLVTIKLDAPEIPIRLP